MQANSLRMDMTVFFIFLLCMTFPPWSLGPQLAVSFCVDLSRRMQTACAWSLPAALASSSLNSMCCSWLCCEFVGYSFFGWHCLCHLPCFWNCARLRQCIPPPDFIAKLFTCSYALPWKIRYRNVACIEVGFCIPCVSGNCLAQHVQTDLRHIKHFAL